MYVRYLRLIAVPFILTLCFVLFLINDQLFSGSGAASGAEHSKPLPTLAGDAAADHLKREGIYDRLMKSIEEDRYRIATSSGTSFSAINSAQHLRAEFSRDGVTFSPMCESAQSESRRQPAQLGSRQKSAGRDWQMRMSLLGYGYGDEMQEAAARLTRTDGNRIETTYVERSSERPVLSEWHVNKQEGIEHGFTIAARPGVNIAGEPLRVRMKIEGDLEARLADEGSAVVFARKDGQETLRYDHLVVEDAMGRSLEAWMEADGDEVSILVDDASAVYPLTIDPIFTEIKKLTGTGTGTDWYSRSVAISGDTVVVGSPLEQMGDYGGAVYIYERNWEGADNWGLVKKLTVLNGAGFARFGWSVGISGDTIVVGDHFTNEAYIYERNWEGLNNWGMVKRLTPSDGIDNEFGYSVAISGDTVIIGAFFDNSQAGAAYIYERNRGGADNWGEVTKLISPGGGEFAEFGYSVAISGDTAVVGARVIDGIKGAAYIYERNQDGADKWGQVAKLTALDGEPGDHFGRSVAISGDTVVVGAAEDDDEKGAAYIYERNQDGADKWGQVQKLTALDGADGDLFGQWVGISGDTVIVGAPFNDVQKGAAYIFERNQGGNNNWGEVEKLVASDEVAFGRFGNSVAISDDTVIVGALFAEGNKGSIYIFVRGYTPCATMPEELPPGTVGVQYSQSVAATPDGNYKYTWEGDIPEGFSLGEETGIISGVTDVPGTYNFIIRARRQDGCIAEQPYTLVIVCPQFLRDPESLATGTAGLPYSESVVAAPFDGYYYSLQTGMLPPGLSLNPMTGQISGMTTATGSYTFTIRAQHQGGCILTQTYTLVIGCPMIALNPASLPDGAAGTPYSATVSATPATTSYTYSVTSGSLPPGLSLNATTGKIAGKPTQNGEFTFWVIAKGFGSCSGSQQYTIRIGSDACPMITLPSLPDGQVGKVYSHSVAASPAGTYSYMVSDGLPPGVTFYNTIGLLYGYPTKAGDYSFTVTVNTGGACSVNMLYEVTINGK